VSQREAREKEKYEAVMKLLSDTEHNSIENRGKDIALLDEKKNKKTMTPMLKKMTRELQEKVEGYSGLLRSWSG
jgi:hypothetical protein